MSVRRTISLGLSACLLILLSQGTTVHAKKPYVQTTFKTAAQAARHVATRANKARFGAFRGTYDVGFKVSDWSVVQGKPYRYRSTFDPTRMHFKLITRGYLTPGTDYIQVAKADLWVKQITSGPRQGKWKVLPTKPARVEQGGYNGDFQMP